MLLKNGIVLALGFACLTGQGTLASEPSPADERLEVAFDKEGAAVRGLTPGSSVAWLGASKGRTDWFELVGNWRHSSSDDDKDGIARYPHPEGFPRETVLVAIDLTNGRWGAAATFPLEWELLAPSLEVVRRGASGQIGSFARRAASVSLLVVRPGQGFWTARVLDGGVLDGDRSVNGVVTVDLPALPARGPKTGTLEGLRPGDIVVTVDTNGPVARVARVNVAGDLE